MNYINLIIINFIVKAFYAKTKIYYFVLIEVINNYNLKNYYKKLNYEIILLLIKYKNKTSKNLNNLFY